MQTEALTKKLKEEEETKRDREESLKYCDKQWAVQSNRVLAEKEAKLAEKRRQNMERKKSAVSRISLFLSAFTTYIPLHIHGKQFADL